MGGELLTAVHLTGIRLRRQNRIVTRRVCFSELQVPLTGDPVLPGDLERPVLAQVVAFAQLVVRAPVHLIPKRRVKGLTIEQAREHRRHEPSLKVIVRSISGGKTRRPQDVLELRTFTKHVEDDACRNLTRRVSSVGAQTVEQLTHLGPG